MTVDEIVFFAIMVFGIQPSEAWRLSPVEYEICWKHYKAINGIKKNDPYTNSDLKRLELKIGRTRRTENKNNG